MGGLKLAYSFFIANKVSLNSHYTLLPFHIIYVSITWAHHTYQRDLFASLYANESHYLKHNQIIKIEIVGYIALVISANYSLILKYYILL